MKNTIPVTAAARRRAARREAVIPKPLQRNLKIVAGYLRLTVDPEGNKIGYDSQKKAIMEWATKEGFTVVWFQDKDITAADHKVKRPQYQEMLARAAEGEFAGIVVWRLDRLVRLTRDFQECLAIAKKTGTFVRSVAEGLSTDGPTGELVMSLLVLLAEIEINAMKTRALAHQQHRAENGLLSGAGERPFGFVGAKKDPATKRVLNSTEVFRKHDPREARLLREAAKAIAYDGSNYLEVINEWAKRKSPVLGTKGRPMEYGALRTILLSPRVAGLREYNIYDEDRNLTGVGLAKAEWEPIIDRETWDILRSRTTYSRRAGKGGHLFTGGIAQCGRCGRPLVAGATHRTGSRDVVFRYQCNVSVSARKTGSCGKLEVQARYMEDVVLEVLFKRLNDSPELHDLVEAHDDGGEPGLRADLMQEIRECDDLLRELARAKSLREGHPDYRPASEVEGEIFGTRERREEADKALSRLRAATTVPEPSEADRSDLRSWFDRQTVEQKRSWLAVHVSAVMVAPSTNRGSRYFDPSRVTPIFPDAKDGGRSGEDGRVGDSDGDSLFGADPSGVQFSVSARVLAGE